MGCELQKIMDAIEGSKSILNELVTSCQDGLSSEETLRVSRELDELLNKYNSMHHGDTEILHDDDFYISEDVQGE